MSSPKVIVQIFLSGSRILGKAFWEAGRQAVKNAKSAPQAAMGTDAAGVGHASSGSPTDQLTRQHRMTLDEAQLILNTKREGTLETVMKNYEHLFKVNSPPPKPEKPLARGQSAPYHSHYLQSKVFRARERLEAEFKLSSQEASPNAAAKSAESTPTTPPPSTDPSHPGGSS
ncbi:Pam16-domain-containing protein [Crepidotus variabilis]|uniref:Mitochondrial import inner membrane translocase subunit TIM16 n=1 Tax=Crepidotus variabilis TaxID=179855 RepID=A0A9P6JSR1_9AGAR|nr:Pam16-domain-containing protein [Crepidotus variabilis]